MSTQPTTGLRAKREQKIRIFNPTMFSDSLEVAGVWYHFDPRGEAYCACARHKDNNRGVHASYEHARDKRNVIQWNEKLRVASDGEMTADNIADLIVGPDCRGGKFYIVLEGSEAEIEAAKKEAIQRWSQLHIQEVEQIITQWERECRELQALQPGALPPRQPPQVQEAYSFRRMWETNKIDRSAFVCLTCGRDCADKDELDNHVVIEHPGIAAERGLTATSAPKTRKARAAAAIPLPERAAATNARDAERLAELKDDDPLDEAKPGELAGPDAGERAEGDDDDDGDETETGQALLERAARTGLDLTVADKKGLLGDDKDVKADVQGRLEPRRAPRRNLRAQQQARGAGSRAQQ